MDPQGKLNTGESWNPDKWLIMKSKGNSENTSKVLGGSLTKKFQSKTQRMVE